MIRVLLADDENLIRTALASLLAIQDDLEVVAQAASGDEALAMARRHRPDVAVLDLQMPGLDGIAVAEQLVTELPACGSLILTSYGRPGISNGPSPPASAGSCPRPSRPRSWPTWYAPSTVAAATSTPNWPPTPSAPGTARSPPAKPTSWNSRQAAPPSMKSRNARP